jgi:hypothetical protein
VSVDPAELSAASDVAAWYNVSGSMAARGVADITSRISKDKEDEASLWQKNSKTAGEVFRPVARRRLRSLAAALRRENVEDGMRSEMARGDRPGYI